MTEPAEFVRVYRAATPFEAHFIRGLLEREQMPVRLIGENLSSGFGELPATVLQVELYVRRSDLGRAREIVETYEERRRTGSPAYTAAEPWDCPACGEQVYASFEICWKCQAPRPESG